MDEESVQQHFVDLQGKIKYLNKIDINKDEEITHV